MRSAARSRADGTLAPAADWIAIYRKQIAKRGDRATLVADQHDVGMQPPDTVQFGTAGPVAGGYTRLMFSDNTKTLLFIAWSIAVFLAALTIGITSVSNWIVVACVAVVPPLVVRSFWRVPEQTISESIHEARR